MKKELMELPYEKSALEPYISAETLEYHYGKHHAAYVNNLNNLIEGTEFEDMSLEDIIKSSTGGIFNNAAQIWNHDFYWNCLAPNAGGQPKGEILSAIQNKFGDFEAFKKEFSTKAVGNFGSGWTWLVKNLDGSIEIVSTSNAGTILTTEDIPLLVIDIWEHAYYIDYRNARPGYVEKFWNLVNWNFVEKNYNQ